MIKKCWWLGLLCAALLVGGCKKSTLQKTGEVKPTTPETKAQTTPAKTAATPEKQKTTAETAQGYDILTLEATIPQETIDAAQNPQDCPRTFLMSLFGVTWSNPHGLVIGSLTKGGLAEQAGLQPGDRIVSCNGEEVTCPATFEPVIRASFTSKEPGKITLIIHRLKTVKGK